MALLAAKSILITGSNRGIGLELVRQLLKSDSPPKHLFATCRNPDKAKELQSLSKEHPNAYILRLDADDEDSITTARMEVENYLGGCGLNLLINNAGINRSLTFDTLSTEPMMEVYKTNVVGPCLITKTLFPLLKIAAAKDTSSPSLSCNRAAVINISSSLGSISATKSFTMHYGYQASKAALNMITKNFSIDFKPYNVLAVAIHPGWVQTEMGGKDADLTVVDSAVGILKVLSTLNDTHNGLLIDYKGTHIPW